MDNFSGRPKAGVLIHEANPQVTACGLKARTLIVALDGKRTENFEQYMFVRDTFASERMQLIVYEDGVYRLVQTDIPSREFRAFLRPWPMLPDDQSIVAAPAAR